MSYVGIGNRQDYIADFPTQSFNGDGSTTTFTLNFEAVTASIRVAVDNVLQPADGSSYYVDGNSLTFSSAPASGTSNISVVYLGTVRQISTVSDNSIANSKIQYPLTESGATVSTFNRTTSDGDIIELQKGGTTVGSIGVNSSDNLYLAGGSGSTKGIYFNGSSMQPANTGGAPNDNGVDIGSGSFRWKDFYLGGSVYLGGTGAANALDDYEEGTWTGTLTGASTSPGTKITSTGVYKKVGSLVHIQIGFENYSGSGYSGQGSVEGLPFTNTSNSRVMINLGSYSALTWTDTLSGLIPQSGSQVEMFDFKSNDTWDAATLNSGSGNYFWITGTYSQA